MILSATGFLILSRQRNLLSPIIEMEESYDAADCLYADLWLELSPESPIYYTFFTDLANPEITAPFGRVVTEQVAARLAQKDYKIVSGQARKDDYTTPEPVRQLPSTQNKEGSLEQNTTATDEPELSLSEQFRPIWPCIMTGDYLIGDDVIFISARINTIRNNQLISSYQWTVPINQNTRTLLPLTNPLN